ncbi:retrotransposon-derived protein PEG10 isoform 2 [Peromyscus maniculatus bairdii]|uniref:Paternally expressed 10 n=1 Tax=Peromyscus maniculatus bairdii TaxID=230844 RepID=A0A6I9GZT4_PERMB|nr:retrotransposon-derived protein PEG10 isoform 2 [Peromyscus maniculatus bairdii]
MRNRRRRRQQRGAQGPGLPPQSEATPGRSPPATMAAAGGSDCPPPPPPPPPNDNNNNNRPSSPVSILGRRRRRRAQHNGDNGNGEDQWEDRRRYHVYWLPSANNRLRYLPQEEEEPEPEPEQVQIQVPGEGEEEEEELQGATAAPSPALLFGDDCLDDLPFKFDGNAEMLNQFLSQCRAFLEKGTRALADDRSRVCFVTSMLIGRAARWATAKLDRYTYLMHNYEAFMLELKLVFEDPERREAAKRRIRRLRQGPDSVADYGNEFHMLALELDWTEPALIDQFLEGLSDAMHEELAHEEIPDTLTELINLCIYIERRMARDAAAAAAAAAAVAAAASAAADGEFDDDTEDEDDDDAQAGAASCEEGATAQAEQTDPTEPVGGARMRLSQEEKERRRKLNLCLYCGSGGHYADNCPAKASKNAPQGNSPAPL